MENPEEILHSLEEFAKLKPKDIPRELEEYLCFVAKTGDPVYQWSAVKSLFKEKLINVITEFYESCPSVEIPPCPNVEMFNYDSMKNFILEKLDTFAAAPFTVQRICELLTTPRKEYNRIDKYMRALEKNILVVSTTEPGNRRNAENGEGIVNGIENEHLPEIIAIATATNDMMKDIDYNASWPRINQEEQSFISVDRTTNDTSIESTESPSASEISPASECRINVDASTSTTESVITCSVPETPSTSSALSISITESEGDVEKSAVEESTDDETQSVPAQVQKRRNSIEPITTDDNAVSEPVESMGGNRDIQSDAVSSETESFSDSSCSNDTIQTDVSDKSEPEDSSHVSEVTINVESPQEHETKLEENSPNGNYQIQMKPPDEDGVKIDIIKISKPETVEEEQKARPTSFVSTITIQIEPKETTIIKDESPVDENPSTKSSEDPQSMELETKPLQDEETPMEVDVENPDSTDQLITEEVTTI